MSRTVLIVDDEFGIVEVLAAALADHGYRTMQAYNGRQALDRMAEEHPDLVISDYMMPGGDGGELLAILAREHAAVPVILMSAVEEASIRRTGISYSAFLRKPFRLAEMLDAVRRLVGHAGDADKAGIH
jgi:DNA-binding response OmpR family regulator